MQIQNNKARKCHTDRLRLKKTQSSMSLREYLLALSSVKLGIISGVSSIRSEDGGKGKGKVLSISTTGSVMDGTLMRTPSMSKTTL